ncbi:hypothetical protein FACS189421_12560 [Bacteroidia bacterium]|nr:hypothetical protein FACS189421_12560 [Bacteroidia bacterium]
MLNVRRAKSADIADLTDILVLFHKYFKELNGETQRIHRAAVQREIQNLAFESHPLLYIYVATENEKVIGAVSFYRGWTTDASLMYHIPYLFIRPEYRGSRATFALLNHISRLARKTNVRRLCFSVYGKNLPVKKLYEHIGAKYWADAEDELFMFFDI